MADTKVSALTALAGADVAVDDLVPVVDTSATATKKMTFAELGAALLTATISLGGILFRGTNILEQRNGTSAQVFRVYGTYSSSGTNGERFEISMAGSQTILRNVAAGTGAARSLVLRPNSNLVFQNSGANTVFEIATSTGHLLFTDNTYNIGAVAASRPANVYVAGAVQGQLRAQGTVPANASATGTTGDIRSDTDYVYVCTATNTWKRAALSTW